jgi:tetratricopeptide (TPR) repeat protein
LGLRPPGNADILNSRGLAWYAKKDFEKAAADFGAAVKSNPEHRHAWFNRALMSCEQKKYAEAIADLDEAVRITPRNADAWKLRGYAKFASGKGDACLPDYKKALEVAPKDWPDRKEIEDWLAKDKPK